MSLSATVVAELNREILTLTRQRAEIDERIAALRKVLRPTEAQTQGDGRPEPVRRDARKRVSKTITKSVVYDALKERPGVKAAAITQLLRERGFKTAGGPKRLSHRVYNELWRMATDGEIVKTPDGRFAPKEGAA